MQVSGEGRAPTDDQAREGVSLAAYQTKIEAYAVMEDWALNDSMRSKHWDVQA